MRNMLLAGVLVSMAFLNSRASNADDAAEIKELIPWATAMPRPDFDNLAAGAQMGTDDFHEKTLTVKLLTMRFNEKRGKEAKEQFEVLSPLKATAVMREMGPVKLDGHHSGLLPATLVQARRITDFKCRVHGDVATGAVSFEVPAMFRGKFDYMAKRKGGKWQVVEITMSANGVHLVRNEKGKWEEEQ